MFREGEEITTRVKRERYGIKKMLDISRSMHGEVSVRTYVVFWEILLEFNVCGC